MLLIVLLPGMIARIRKPSTIENVVYRMGAVDGQRSVYPNGTFGGAWKRDWTMHEHTIEITRLRKGCVFVHICDWSCVHDASATMSM